MRGALEALSPERLPLAGLRRFAWRAFYDALARRFPQGDWTFMNYGFVAEGADAPSARAAFEGLYAEVLRAGPPIAGADVVEVGSGRGGGARWLAETCAARSVLAIDIAPAAVALARALHPRVPGLAFESAPAHDLPCRDASADVVVSVESCHHYPSVPAFLAEAWRVLRPGDWFCAASYFDARAAVRLREAMAGSAFDVIEIEDISEGVLRALAVTEEFKAQLIERHAPWAWRPLLHHFAGMRDSWLDRLLVDGRTVYLRAALVKRPQ